MNKKKSSTPTQNTHTKATKKLSISLGVAMKLNALASILKGFKPTYNISKIFREYQRFSLQDENSIKKLFN